VKKEWKKKVLRWETTKATMKATMMTKKRKKKE
jgi:hypothetical protein